jgi:hypothetical protein
MLSTFKQKQLENNLFRLKTELSRYRKIIIQKELEKKDLEQELQALRMKLDQRSKEKRLCKRKNVGLAGEIIFGDLIKPVLIEDISGEGMRMKISPSRDKVNITVGRRYEVRFRIPSGEVLNSLCDATWLHIIPPHNLNKVGMKVAATTARFKDFLDDL